MGAKKDPNKTSSADSTGITIRLVLSYANRDPRDWNRLDMSVTA